MRSVLASLLVAATGLFVLAPTPGSSADDRPLRYVALGDSYSAASGNFPPDPSAQPECARSLVNYPHVIANRTTPATFKDVSCGGADTTDFFRSQYNGVPPQLDAVRPKTTLVTMTIGGNNNNTFIDAIVKCGTGGVSTGGQGSPCKDRYGSSFAHDIRTKTFPALKRSLRAVQARAPKAVVAILGYPWILPERVGCFDKMPVARGDVPYLRHVQWVLNDAVRRAAAVTGARYVNFNRVSEGHDACQPIGVRWVEPVLQGTNPVVVHPNALGEQHMATRTIRVLGLE